MEENSDLQLVEASTIKRFINYVIDYLVMAILVSFIFTWIESLGYPIIADVNTLRVRIIAILIYALLYLLIEGSTRGKTPGKWLTKTRVLEYDGSIPDFETFVIRSFSRIIPLEPISFLFGKGWWHDRISKTIVIDEIMSELKNENDG